MIITLPNELLTMLIYHLFGNDIPYIGYDWIPETTKLCYGVYPESIRIPRDDLLSINVINSLSKRYAELKTYNY